MNQIYCGIDFHKNTSMIIAVDEKGTKVVQDNIKSASLKTYFSGPSKSAWKIAIEATGGSNHVTQMLRDLKLEVTLINPNQFRGIGIPDGHFKIPHLWPPKIPQSARTWWAG